MQRKVTMCDIFMTYSTEKQQAAVIYQQESDDSQSEAIFQPMWFHPMHKQSGCISCDQEVASLGCNALLLTFLTRVSSIAWQAKTEE